MIVFEWEFDDIGGNGHFVDVVISRAMVIGRERNQMIEKMKKEQEQVVLSFMDFQQAYERIRKL